MTDDERRLALITGACPECGHSILAHQRGYCMGRITRFSCKVYCLCRAVQPPNSTEQGSLDFRQER